ncbi:MAG: hypothetical protein M3Z14_06075 [Candidatus Eremiobacteraeota bacterium]|nr:hypothetical protein [Candidatus Eremiobacteraeota bacterium]
MTARLRKVAGVLGCCLVMSACSHNQAKRPASVLTKDAAPQLSAGGRTIFPAHRVVAYYGAAEVPALGVLGQGPPVQIARKLLSQVRRYEIGNKRVIPAFELIATVAQRSPGAAGKYSASSEDAIVARYLSQVRKMKGLLILDIQPGRASFSPEVRRYEKFLLEPDVSVALDPEWKMSASEIPDQQIGHTDAAAVNEVSAFLAQIIKRHNLPQKLLVIHEFTTDMVEHKERILDRPGVAITFHVDGFGSRAAKLSKYRILSRAGSGRFLGFKLFYDQDPDLLSPSEVLRLMPRPDLITYQ